MLRAILRNAFLGLLLVLMSLAALGGIAAAVWSAVGAGSASGTAGSTVAVTLTPGAPASQLYPGGLADVVLTVTNSNAAPVRIGTLSSDTTRGDNGFAVDALHSECALSTLAFATQTNATAGWTVPAHEESADGSLSITLTGALSMSTTAASACQGATFTVFLVGEP